MQLYSKYKSSLQVIACCTLLACLGACSSGSELKQTNAENQLAQLSSPKNPEGLERTAEPRSTTPPLLEKVEEQSSEQNYTPAHNQRIFTPYTGSKARIYGSYNLGCIDGAVSLSDENQTFQFQRWSQDRHYAHPILANYIFDLAKRAEKAGLPPLMFGDMSLPYGGAMGPNSSHASHETGLDLDIPFDFALPRKSQYDLQHPKDVYIVKGQKILKNFTPAVVSLIRLAATDPRVDRIFVAPMIKKRMCQLYEGKEPTGSDSFLQKLRPWFGHQAHMHVRLKCPSDSPECITQKPIAAGTGCGYEVDSWFLPPPKSTQTTTVKKKKKKPEIPQKCQLLFKKVAAEKAASNAPSNTKATAK